MIEVLNILKCFINFFLVSWILLLSFIIIESNKIVIDFYYSLILFCNGCKWECYSDFNCNGFIINSSICFFSKCDKYIDV